MYVAVTARSAEKFVNGGTPMQPTFDCPGYILGGGVLHKNTSLWFSMSL